MGREEQAAFDRPEKAMRDGDLRRGTFRLVPEHQNLGFSRGPGPKQPSEGVPDQLAEITHHPRAPTDSPLAV
jgi:hypothetical protein